MTDGELLNNEILNTPCGRLLSRDECDELQRMIVECMQARATLARIEAALKDDKP